MSTNGDQRERAHELLLAELLIGLGPAEREELLRLVDPAERETFEQAVAALNLAGLGALEAPPAGLEVRLAADARAHFALAGPSSARAPTGAPAPAAPARDSTAAPARLGLVAAVGWLAAAAAVLVLVLQRLAERTPALDARRQELVASASDLVRADWSATEDPLAAGVTGDVVWSSSRQEGYMRFRSLAPNDPTQAQYQLWIFDSTRDDWEAKPVDGGVFDVRPGAEVLVPITAKLAVHRPALFAVTLEAPGGVVVSRREHLLVTAAP